MRTFKLELDEKQMQILNDALVVLPFNTIAPLISHINECIQKQFNAEQGNSNESIGAKNMSPDQDYLASR
jgi:hypothetical protein